MESGSDLSNMSLIEGGSCDLNGVGQSWPGADVLHSPGHCQDPECAGSTECVRHPTGHQNVAKVDPRAAVDASRQNLFQCTADVAGHVQVVSKSVPPLNPCGDFASVRNSTPLQKWNDARFVRRNGADCDNYHQTHADGHVMVNSMVPCQYMAIFKAASSVSKIVRCSTCHVTPECVKLPHASDSSTPCSSRAGRMKDVYNPFKDVDRDHFPLLSPNFFREQAPGTPESSTFRWGVNNISELQPIHIDERDIRRQMLKQSPDLGQDERRQMAINYFFKHHMVAPSPWAEKIPPHILPLTPAYYQDTYTPDHVILSDNVYLKPKGIGIDKSTQTTLSLPFNLDLESLLGEFMTFCRDGVEHGNVMESGGSSSLRRKLFLDADTSSTCSPLGEDTTCDVEPHPINDHFQDCSSPAMWQDISFNGSPSSVQRFSSPIRGPVAELESMSRSDLGTMASIEISPIRKSEQLFCVPSESLPISVASSCLNSNSPAEIVLTEEDSLTSLGSKVCTEHGEKELNRNVKALAVATVSNGACISSGSIVRQIEKNGDNVSVDTLNCQSSYWDTGYSTLSAVQPVSADFSAAFNSTSNTNMTDLPSCSIRHNPLSIAGFQKIKDTSENVLLAKESSVDPDFGTSVDIEMTDPAAPFAAPSSFRRTAFGCGSCRGAAFLDSSSMDAFSVCARLPDGATSSASSTPHDVIGRFASSDVHCIAKDTVASTFSSSAHRGVRLTDNGRNPQRQTERVGEWDHCAAGDGFFTNDFKLLDKMADYLQNGEWSSDDSDCVVGERSHLQHIDAATEHLRTSCAGVGIHPAVLRSNGSFLLAAPDRQCVADPASTVATGPIDPYRVEAIHSRAEVGRRDHVLGSDIAADILCRARLDLIAAEKVTFSDGGC